ncbi:hypothetical protein [Bacillus cereus]|uniref:hypothetical protein n=1 Tax=Bacillus cereus group TaxID=86661 RepID=UPI001BA99A09|nr:hypothetical protein [Bacillus cereus]
MEHLTTTDLIRMEANYVEDVKEAVSLGHYNTAYQFTKQLVKIKQEKDRRISEGKW